MARMRRPPASLFVFLLIVAGVMAWIGSGMLERDAAPPSAAGAPPPVMVAAQWSEAETVERLLTLYGDIEPNQIVRVRAETAGQVAEMNVSRGDMVEPGQRLARLSLGDRPAQLRRAEAQLARAQQEYDAARQLVERDAAPEIRLQNAEADLQAAQAEVDAVQIEIDNTSLEAPIAGVVNEVIADIGDFVAVGGEVVVIVDNDPLLATVQVPQHSISRVRAGGEARVSMIGADPLEGTVRSVAPLADAETRTFRVEIEIPNPEGELPAGVSAEVVIPTETVAAHRISPAMVSLDDEGRIGVYSVDEDDAAVFHEITVIRSEADGVWVTGPPERARLITARPGFVQDGQLVDAREPDAFGGETPAGS